MLKQSNKLMNSALPIEGELSNGLRGSAPDWVFILKIIITVLTALAGALGIASCTA